MTRQDEGVLIFGLILCIGGIVAVAGLYSWAAWDWGADAGKPRSEQRPVRYVPPRYLLTAGIGGVVGLLLIALSQSQ